MEFSKEIGDILFDGYWKGGANRDPKARLGKSEPKPYDEAIEKFPFMLGKIKPDVVMVDYDNLNAFQSRLDIAKASNQHCIVIKSPNKGGHFYWFNRKQSINISNSGNKTVLTLSPIDYKCGIRVVKSTGEVKEADNYGCLSKTDKSFREVVYCNIYDDLGLDEIPFYDLPMKSGTKHNFLGMAEGDSRQDGLFTYMNPMKAAGYSYEQYKEVAELIDRHIFKEPLEDEFENAIRQEAWDSVKAVNASRFFGCNKQFLHNKFGDYLIEKHHIKKINGQLHVYDEGVYIPGYEVIERAMIKEIPSLTSHQRNEVLKYLNAMCENTETGDLHLIAFKNGNYNLNTGEFEPFDPKHIITNKIPWNYNPNAESELVESVLDKLSCGDQDIRYLLEEVAGACLYRSNTLGGGKATILTGDKENGKSTYLDMVSTMIGKGNYSALDIKNIGDRFSTIMMYGMLANIGDDISDDYIPDTSILKKLVTGEPMKAEEKGKPPITFTSYATQLYSCNGIPRMHDPTGAALRRLLFVPFNAKFSKDDPDYDPAIKYKLRQAEHVERFIYLAICGLHDILDNKTFTVPKRVQAEKDAYEKENNPILAFIEDVGKGSIFNEPTADVYLRYQLFCNESGLKGIMGKPTFSKRINQALGTEIKQKKINHKNIKIFIRGSSR